MVDAKLADAVEEFGVSEKAQLQPVDPDLDAGLGALVLEGPEPVEEDDGCADFDHVQTIVFR
jgi:hypothetical protein